MVAENLKNEILSDKKSEIIIPSLRKDLDLFLGKKDFDGSQTWVIHDPVSDKYFRISEKEYNIIIFLSNNTTLDEVYFKVKRINPKIEKQDILQVINFFSNNSLLKSSHKITENRLINQAYFKRKILSKKILSSLLFVRIPVWKPDVFITKSYTFVKAIFNKWILLLLAIMSFCGYISVIVNWDKFTSAIISSLTYSGLIKYGITIIFLKAVHEFAHAYTAKSAGIRVRRFGVGFIIFFPRFYTDLTDSWIIQDKKVRMLIDAAGILTELLIGGLAALFWLYTGPGVANTISYFVFAVSIINTVIINGNPFIKFDGYYLLMDFANIDNLQQRSIVEIRTLFRKYFFGIKDIASEAFTGARKHFLIFFGISCFIYRIFLYTSIILIVYIKFTKALGIILACIEIYLLFLKPIITETKKIMMIKSKIKNKNFLISTSALILILILLFAPLPWSVSLPCVVDSEKNSLIYIKYPGFLDKFLVKNSEKVKKDQVLLKEKNPQLEYDYRIQKTNLKIFKMQLDQMKASDVNLNSSEKAKIQQILKLENDIKENQRKIDLLSITTPINGIFILSDWHLKTGKWLNKGELLGEVFTPNKLLISAYAKESLVGKIAVKDKVKVLLHDVVTPVYGKVLKINAYPKKVWQASPLLSAAGGPLEVLKQKDNYNYILKEYYYQIIIKPDNPSQKLSYSKTGIVHIRKYSSVGLNFLRSIIFGVQKILSF